MAMARKCAQTRWSTLVNKRLGADNGLRDLLGETRWADFLKAAKQHHLAKWLQRFEGASLSCSGDRAGRSCPQQTVVQPATQDLSILQIDHDVDLKLTCEKWRSTITLDSTWNGNLPKKRLLMLLFEMVHFRCCLPHVPVQERCHRLDLANYHSRKTLKHVLRESRRGDHQHEARPPKRRKPADDPRNTVVQLQLNTAAFNLSFSTNTALGEVIRGPDDAQLAH
ncbi:Protein nlrc3 [Durusdinium trenchii]|uniref:Protein nlrc3 n=1 Tax=Durusdinium trenchii TaxID=1381693 RepID=A0ABP0MPY9_9DINO